MKHGNKKDRAIVARVGREFLNYRRRFIKAHDSVKLKDADKYHVQLAKSKQLFEQVKSM
ncbi:MAG: hypothetical protein RL755_19 [Pseudomonadota bacterium]|jgi:hypothetical protein